MTATPSAAPRLCNPTDPPVCRPPRGNSLPPATPCARTTPPPAPACLPGRRPIRASPRSPLAVRFRRQQHLSARPLVEDYDYTPGSGDLDQYNDGRSCVTPDFPNGTYAYFVTISSTGAAAFPYYLGPQFYRHGVRRQRHQRSPSPPLPTTTATRLPAAPAPRRRSTPGCSSTPRSSPRSSTTRMAPSPTTTSTGNSSAIDADIQEIRYSTSYVYLNISGLASHLMRPWVSQSGQDYGLSQPAHQPEHLLAHPALHHHPHGQTAHQRRRAGPLGQRRLHVQHAGLRQLVQLLASGRDAGYAIAPRHQLFLLVIRGYSLADGGWMWVRRTLWQFASR